MAYWLDQFHIFLLVLARVSALLTVAPIFGHRMYLGRAKIGMAIMISFVAFPLVAERGLDVPEALIPYVMMLLAEAKKIPRGFLNLVTTSNPSTSV